MSDKCKECSNSWECLGEGRIGWTEFCSMWDPETKQEFSDVMERFALEPDSSWRDALPEHYRKFLSILDELGSPPQRTDPKVTDEEMECIEEICDESTPCELLCGKLGLVYCPLK